MPLEGAGAPARCPGSSPRSRRSGELELRPRRLGSSPPPQPSPGRAPWGARPCRIRPGEVAPGPEQRPCRAVRAGSEGRSHGGSSGRCRPAWRGGAAAPSGRAEGRSCTLLAWRGGAAAAGVEGRGGVVVGPCGGEELRAAGVEGRGGGRRGGEELRRPA